MLFTPSAVLLSPFAPPPRCLLASLRALRGVPVEWIAELRSLVNLAIPYGAGAICHGGSFVPRAGRGYCTIVASQNDTGSIIGSAAHTAVRTHRRPVQRPSSSYWECLPFQSHRHGLVPSGTRNPGGAFLPGKLNRILTAHLPGARHQGHERISGSHFIQKMLA